MKKMHLSILLLLLGLTPSHALDGKTLGHVIAIPVIEGTGIYSSIKMIQTATPNGTATGITNLSLIGINAAMGAYTLFGKPADYATWRTIHRITGAATFAASAWLAVSAWKNSGGTNLDKGIATGYSVLAAVPVIMFSF